MKTLTLLLIIFIAVPTMAAMPLQEGITDDSSITLEYTGTWSTVSEASAFGSSYASTTDVSATLSWQTYATGFTLFYILTPTGGDIELCIDVNCQTLPTAGSTSQAALTLTGLSNTLKSITLTKLTDDGLPISFDAVYIYPSQPLEVPDDSYLIAQHFEYESSMYTGVLDLRITSGDVAIILLLLFLIVIQIGQLVAQVIER